MSEVESVRAFGYTASRRTRVGQICSISRNLLGPSPVMTMLLIRLGRTSIPAGRGGRRVSLRRLIPVILGALAAAMDPVSCSPALAEEGGASTGSRTREGLQVLYLFDAAEGSQIPDRSGVDPPLHLRIPDERAVRRTPGELEVTAPTLLPTEQPADRLVKAIQHSGAVTLEAWVRPQKVDQSGPARIVTLSRNPNERNITVGHDGGRCEVRLRTTETNPNGIPPTTSPDQVLTPDWTHLVFTRSREGVARLYVNGRLQTERKVGGRLDNWSPGYRLALANELTEDRPWLGSYRLVAIYSRDLSAEEVLTNFRSGGGIGGGAPLVQGEAHRRFFERRIAPLFAKHCLECHETAARQGGLDLSRKSAALAGGDGGAAIVAGRPEESLLWKRVAADEMPLDREPLTADEKEWLRRWLSDGAAWSLEVLDPAVYHSGEQSEKVFVQRLTIPEYIAAVRDVLGVEIAAEAREILPPDLRADGFSNTAYNLNVDLGHVEAYARLAELIAERLDAKGLARKYTSSRELTDENITKIVEPLGRKLLRGPLSKEEVARYCGVSTSVAAAGGNFEEAVRYILQAMLQSPRFLYRIEDQRVGGPLGPYELAARLSFIVWGSSPDDELLEAAEKGRLDRGGVERQLARMLQDRRAVERSLQFVSDWLHLDRLPNLRPNPQRFPRWNAALAEDMRRETLAFFEEIAWKQRRPLSDLLNAPLTFVTPRLARHYGLEVPQGAGEEELVKYDLTRAPARGGLLTQGSLLTVGGDDASMVTRGLFVMHELLRGVVRDPPPCVDTTPVPTRPGLTQRAISEIRLANTNCTGCHGKFEPLAFGLEKFDGLGTYRDQDEHGNPLREDGFLLVPGEAQPRNYSSTRQLQDLLAQSERVRETFTWKLTQFSLGRPLGAVDAAAVAEIHRTAWANGGTYADLVTAIVLSDLVQRPRVETEPD